MELNFNILPLDAAAMDRARQRQTELAKPPGSLGRLEALSVQLAGITGKVHNSVKRQHLLVFAADNGVVAEGVSSAPQSVTLSQTINFTRRLTGVGSMAKYFGIDLLVVDMGVKMDIPQELYCEAMTECRCGGDHHAFQKILQRHLLARLQIDL